MNERFEKSPSGKYTLTIETVETRPGCWDYTTGWIRRKGSFRHPMCGPTVIAMVKRNYSSFPFLWIEGHANGHDYLVCGENYQGQTVIELDTGARRDHLPPEAKQGHGFCWVGYEYNKDFQLLVVNGCYWACPYEWRFYDFSDPMNGWLQIGEDICIDSSEKDPVITFDGLITCYETRDFAADDSEEDDIKVVATRTFKRDGMKLVEVDSWVDKVEAVRRAEHEASNKKWNEEWEEYKRTNLLYLLVKDRWNKYDNNDSYISVGRTHDGWHPDLKFDDGLVHKRLASQHKKDSPQGVTIDLEWGRKVAPIKLSVSRNDKESEDIWYPRSLEGMNAALDRAESEL